MTFNLLQRVPVGVKLRMIEISGAVTISCYVVGAICGELGIKRVHCCYLLSPSVGSFRRTSFCRNRKALTRVILMAARAIERRVKRLPRTRVCTGNNLFAHGFT